MPTDERAAVGRFRRASAVGTTYCVISAVAYAVYNLCLRDVSIQ